MKKLRREELILFIFTLTWSFRASYCFIPAELFNNVLIKLDKVTRVDFGQVSETITHEEILRRGVIASVTQFLIDHPIAGSQVSYAKLNQYYEVIFFFFNQNIQELQF